MAYKLAKVIVFPEALALKYEQYILKKLRNTIAALNKELKPFFSNNKIREQARQDDYVDDLQKILREVAEFIAINDNQLIRELFIFGSSLLQYTRKQLTRSFKDILSVRVATPSFALNVFNTPLLDKNIDLMLKSWVSTNTSLIKSIQTDLLGQVGVVIESSYRSGLSMPELTKQLQAKFDISRNRAKLIAVDQTAKLHSDYIMHEYRLLNINEYFWRTSNDDKVRTSHRVLNNKVCQVNDPTTYRDSVTGKLKKKSSIGGDPHQFGQAIRCRCTGYAIVYQ